MARNGRRTRTVLIADRLTLCPSSEYSSILRRRKTTAMSLASWSDWPWQTLNVYRESSTTQCTVSGIHSLLTTNHRGLCLSGPYDAIVILQSCHAHTHTRAHTQTQPSNRAHTHAWHLTGIKQVSKLYTKPTHTHTHFWLIFNVRCACVLVQNTHRASVKHSPHYYNEEVQSVPRVA